MTETSSGLTRKSLAIFGNLQRFLENVWGHLCGLQIIFGESSEIFRKWLEIFGQLSKTLLSLHLYNKQNNTRLLVDMEYVSAPMYYPLSI